MNGTLLIAAAMPLLFGSALAATAIAEWRRSAIRRRIHQTIGGYRGTSDGATPLALDVERKARASLARAWLPEAAGNWVNAELAATGDRLSLIHLLAAGMLAGAAGLGLAADLLALDRLPALALAALLALGVPVALLRHMQQRLQSRFLDGFPDALDFIIRAVRAGLPVIDALNAVGTELPAPVGTEFRRIHDGIAIGIAFDEELARAARRIRLTEFRFFIVALTLQRQTGGNLAETLENLSTMIRRRKEMRLKARAMTSETRASAWLIGCLPFIAAALLHFISPNYIEVLFTDPRGHVLMGIATASLALGAVIMRVMVKQAAR